MSNIDTLTCFVEMAKKRAEEYAKKGKNVYLDDEGYLCCGNCHTRKEREIILINKPVRVFQLCECEAKAEKLREEAIKKADIQNEIDYWKRYGFSNDDYGKHTFAEDDCQNSVESRMSRNYVAHFEEMRKANLGIIFYGDCDRGKSFYCSCICNALSQKGYFIIMTSLSTLAERMEINFKQERSAILEGVRNAHLLILDDVGTERQTPQMLENIYEIINARYVVDKPMIISTNLKPEELGTNDIRLKRIYQRILQGTKKINCTIPHHRMQLNSSQQDALKLLGM